MTEEQLQLLIAYIREVTLARIFDREGQCSVSVKHYEAAEGIEEELLATCKKQEESCNSSST